MFLRWLILIAIVLTPDSCCHAAGWGHNRMVAKSGIKNAPLRTVAMESGVRMYEGVGRSTVSYEDARNHACYWGQRTPVSIQYSRRGKYYYAVVRYQ